VIKNIKERGKVMKKKTILSVVISMLVLVLIVSGCAQNTGQPETSAETSSSETQEATQTPESTVEETQELETITLKMGSVANENNLQYEAAKLFADTVNEKSGGRITVELLFSGQLGAEADMIDSMRIGGLDMMLGFPTNWTNVVPEMGVYDLPFMFEDIDQVRSLQEGEFGNTLADMVEAKTGIKVLGWWRQGFRHIYSKRAFSNTEEIKGLKIRVPGSPTFVDVFNALEAEPVSIPWGEVYTALQTNLVEACEADLSGAVASSFFEVADYVIKTGHIYNGAFIAISGDVYNGLDDEAKGILDEANGIATDWLFENADAAMEEAQSTLMENGMTVIEPNVADFQSKLSGIVDTFLANVPDAKGLVDLVKAGE
jgi:tripartite ATP-independent transporter DctP family solute receptor